MEKEQKLDLNEIKPALKQQNSFVCSHRCVTIEIDVDDESFVSKSHISVPEYDYKTSTTINGINSMRKKLRKIIHTIDFLKDNTFPVKNHNGWHLETFSQDVIEYQSYDGTYSLKLSEGKRIYNPSRTNPKITKINKSGIFKFCMFLIHNNPIKKIIADEVQKALRRELTNVNQIGTERSKRISSECRNATDINEIIENANVPGMNKYDLKSELRNYFVDKEDIVSNTIDRKKKEMIEDGEYIILAQEI